MMWPHCTLPKCLQKEAPPQCGLYWLNFASRKVRGNIGNCYSCFPQASLWVDSRGLRAMRYPSRLTKGLNEMTALMGFQFSSVQLLSRVRLLATPWTAARQASLSITNSRSPPKPMSIESVMPSNHLILCCSLLLLPSIFPSIKVFSNESAFHIRWPKYGSFSFNISPSNDHPGLISFRMDVLDVLAIQGTLKSLLIPQFKSINSSVLSFLYGV